MKVRKNWKIIKNSLLEKTMKSKKWLTYTLGILLTFVVLAAVGGFGYRLGVTQSASFAKLTDGATARAPFFAHGDGFDGNFNKGDWGRPSHGFDRGGVDRGDFHGGFFSPILGLIRLVVLGALVWLGYKLVKNSGWKLVKANASESAAPVTEQPSEAAAGDEKKE